MTNQDNEKKKLRQMNLLPKPKRKPERTPENKEIAGAPENKERKRRR